MTPIEKDLNVENVQMLINHLEKTKPDNFDMGCWLEGPGAVKRGEDLKAMIRQMQTTGGCGTTGCIAGHAALLARALDFEVQYDYCIESVAIEWLGLSHDGAERLFRPNNGKWDIIAKKLPTVIRTLKHLRDTKRVSWHVPASAYPKYKKSA